VGASSGVSRWASFLWVQVFRRNTAFAKIRAMLRIRHSGVDSSFVITTISFESRKTACTDFSLAFDPMRDGMKHSYTVTTTGKSSKV
jgi:hypothetical protein